MTPPESSPLNLNTKPTATPSFTPSPPIVMGSPANAASDEYYAILRVVSEYDARFITVKSWSVTLSLAGLGLAFTEEQHWLFLLATVSSLSFWAIEASSKWHQMRYYRRMRAIEVATYEAAIAAHHNGSSPLIDWAWDKAEEITIPERPEQREPAGKLQSIAKAVLLPWVFLPHALAAVAGGLLFHFNPTNLP